MNFHQMSHQSSHMSSKLPGQQQNSTVAQVSGWSSSMPSQYDSQKPATISSLKVFLCRTPV